MLATEYTSMGYFSNDADSRFDVTRRYASPTSPNGIMTANGLNWGDESESADIQRLQSVYKLPKTGVAGALGGRVPASAYATN